MDRDDAEEYTQALGQVVAGGWRQVALGERLGVPRALGLTTRDWVEQRLGGYVRLAVPDRREAVAELTEEGMSTREIGAVLGVGKSTVDRDVDALAVPSGTDEDLDLAPGATPTPDPAPNGTPPEPSPIDLHDTDLGREADNDAAVRRHRAMKDFMDAVSKTAALLPQIDNVIAGVLEVDAERARDEAERTLATWQRVAGALVQSSQLRRVK
jgi:hypothetical protein